MVQSDKEFCDTIHILIHSARLIPNYKPAELEKKLSALVIKKYSETCEECKEVGERNKNMSKPKNFLNKLGDILIDGGA